MAKNVGANGLKGWKGSFQWWRIDISTSWGVFIINTSITCHCYYIGYMEKVL